MDDQDTDSTRGGTVHTECDQGQRVGTGDSKSDLEDWNSEYEVLETSKPIHFPCIFPFMYTQGCIWGKYKSPDKWEAFQ